MFSRNFCWQTLPRQKYLKHKIINFTIKIREIDFTKKLQINGLSVFIIIDKMGETHEVVIMREISPFVVFQLFQFENWVFQFPVLGLYYNFHSSTKNLLKCIFIIRYILLNKNYIIFFPDFHWILWWWSPRQYNCWIRKRTHGETNRLCLPWDVSWIGTFT